jgi:hypothetical protein
MSPLVERIVEMDIEVRVTENETFIKEGAGVGF